MLKTHTLSDLAADLPAGFGDVDGGALSVAILTATVDLTLAFFEEVLGGANGLLAARSARYDGLLARFESEPQAAP